MRVTPGMTYARLAGDLQRALASLTRQESFVATGRRIVAPADDPSGAAQALATRARQTANLQFQRNLTTIRGNLESADSVVRSVIDGLHQARDLALQGANDSTDALVRQAIGIQVDQILEAQVSLSNTRGPRGTMLFGGQEVTVAPYTVTRDGAGKITAVAVNPRGIDATVSAAVADGLTVAQGVSGTSVFGALTDTTNAFDTLIRMRDALNANNRTNIEAAMGDANTASDRALLAMEVVGTRLGWLEALETRLKDEALVIDQSLSRIEDVDVAKAVTDLREIQASYEAGLAAGARLLQRSLLDFLK